MKNLLLRFLLCFFVFLAGLAATLVLTFIQKPTYRATTLVEIRPIESGAEKVDEAQQWINTQRILMTIEPNIQRVCLSLDLPRVFHDKDGMPARISDVVERVGEMVRVEQVEDSWILAVTCTNESDERAERIANKVAEVYQNYQLDLAVMEMQHTLDNLERLRKRNEEKLVHAEDLKETMKLDGAGALPMQRVERQIEAAEQISKELAKKGVEMVPEPPIARIVSPAREAKPTQNRLRWFSYGLGASLLFSLLLFLLLRPRAAADGFAPAV